MRYAVQAKKLDLKTGRYASLNHVVGKGAAAEYQHNILEAYAKANRAIPLYAFYNYVQLPDYSDLWNCPLPFDLTKLGCTVTPLKNVKTAIANRGWRTFERIHKFKETVPLRCLAECPNIAHAASDGHKLFIERFDIEAFVYRNPWGWISEMGHLSSFDQMPHEFYNHELGYYPKRILLIETHDEESNN